MLDLLPDFIHAYLWLICPLHSASCSTVSPTFVDPKGAVIFAPLGGRLELKSTLKSMPFNADIRFTWFLNDRPIRTSG